METCTLKVYHKTTLDDTSLIYDEVSGEYILNVQDSRTDEVMLAADVLLEMLKVLTFHNKGANIEQVTS